MLYQLSYASRRKPIIIPAGNQIARQTTKFFLARPAALGPALSTQDTTRPSAQVSI